MAKVRKTFKCSRLFEKNTCRKTEAERVVTKTAIYGLLRHLLLYFFKKTYLAIRKMLQNHIFNF